MISTVTHSALLKNYLKLSLTFRITYIFTLNQFAALVLWTTLKNPNKYDLLFLAHMVLQNAVPTFLSIMHRTFFKASNAAISSVKCSSKNLERNATIIHHPSNGSPVGYRGYLCISIRQCLVYYRPILVIRSFRLVRLPIPFVALTTTMEIQPERSFDRQ